jgi:hypothetical protein
VDDFMQALTEFERHAILALAEEFNSDEERDQLLADLVNCSVEETVPDGSLLEFSILATPAMLGTGNMRTVARINFQLKAL